jgi:hypothetical protein
VFFLKKKLASRGPKASSWPNSQELLTVEHRVPVDVSDIYCVTGTDVYFYRICCYSSQAVWEVKLSVALHFSS